MLFCDLLQQVELFGNSPTHCQKHEIEADIFCTKCCYTKLEYIGEPINQISQKSVKNSQRNGSLKLLLEMKRETRFGEVTCKEQVK